MTKKILFLIFLLYLSTIGIVNAFENSVTIPLVAARMTENGEEGIYLNAQVVVKNGTGHVFVDTNPYTQVDLQGSARIAAMVASDVLGEDQRLYDFYYIIEIDSPIVGGPSAGGALTVATIAAMKNWTIKGDIAMTGTINPDETIGPVGGIPYKLEAAAAKGTKIFLVPQGQLVVNETNITNIEEHYKNGREIKKDVFDINQLGMKLNVTVKEVNTIQEAVLEFTGYDISKPISNKTVFSSEYLKLLEPLANRLKNESKDMYNNVSNVSNINNNLTKNAKELQNRADDLTNDRKYYGATSLYFQSMINLLASEWINKSNQEKNKSEYIANLTELVDKQIKDSENDLDKFKSKGISDVNIIGAAESRIMEANNTLENIKVLSNPNDIILSLAFSYQRAKSAQWWLTLTTPSDRIIPEDILRERAGWYMSQAISISTYTETLITESQGNIPTNGMFDTTNIQKEIQRGYYSGAIFDSLQVISTSGTVIRALSTKDLANNINQSASSAQTVINDVRSEGIEPTLAVSAYEFGEISPNPYNKMTQFTYAKMIAKTTEVLYSHSVSTNKSEKENISNVSSKRSPGFNAIVLLIIIFVMRKLKKDKN